METPTGLTLLGVTDIELLTRNGVDELIYRGTFKETVSHLINFKAHLKSVDEVVGISENKIVNFSIYPNPSNGILNLSDNTASITKVEINNILGQVFFKEQYYNQNTIEIDISNYPTGTYLVKIRDAKANTSTVKLIKNN